MARELLDIHLWLRAEERANETRTPLMPSGAAELLRAGYRISVERNAARCVPDQDYETAGCDMVATGSWRNAPKDAIILGLKELPDDGTPLGHRHIMFGHAFKGQPDGPRLLERFAKGAGTLLDLEYLLDANGRRLAAFGYWAGFAGAAVTLKAWIAQLNNSECAPVQTFASIESLCAEIADGLSSNRPKILVIGALGRVGNGARDFCKRVGLRTTDWDLAETKGGGPFGEVLEHDILLNCILAGPGGPVFVPRDAVAQSRTLRTIGDIACDPGSEYNPVPIYDAATTWAQPVVRVAKSPVLDVMAIDNLPSLLPRESSEDFSQQLFPLLARLAHEGDDVWQRANDLFDAHTKRLKDDKQ